MCELILGRKRSFTPAARHTQSCCERRGSSRWYHTSVILPRWSQSSQSLYLVSYWTETLLKPGRWTSRSGCGPAGPSKSRSVRSRCRAQCDFRRPGCAPAGPSMAGPARRSCTSAGAQHTRLTGRHGHFIKQTISRILWSLCCRCFYGMKSLWTFLKSNRSST